MTHHQLNHRQREVAERLGLTAILPPKRTAAEWRSEAEETQRQALGEINESIIAATPGAAEAHLTEARHKLHILAGQLKRAIAAEMAERDAGPNNEPCKGNKSCPCPEHTQIGHDSFDSVNDR